MITDAWQAAPDVLAPPAAGQVIVLQFSTAAPSHADETAALYALLDAPEQARCARLRFADDRARFAATHARMRRILGEVLGRASQAVRITTAENGKPWLADAPDLHFNLSHSGAVALLALGGAVAVGVDVERIRPDIDALTIAERFFAAPESAALAALPPEQHAAVFFALWTRKEAALKLRGDGIRAGLAGDCLPPDAQDCLLDGIPGYAASLAVASRAALTPICWRWGASSAA